MHKSQRKLSFGPACTLELHAVGIITDGDIRLLGWQEAFLRWTARFPARINLNAAAGLIAAEKGVHWLELTPADKAPAAQLIKRLRETANG